MKLVNSVPNELSFIWVTDSLQDCGAAGPDAQRCHCVALNRRLKNIIHFLWSLYIDFFHGFFHIHTSLISPKSIFQVNMFSICDLMFISLMKFVILRNYFFKRQIRSYFHISLSFSFKPPQSACCREGPRWQRFESEKNHFSYLISAVIFCILSVRLVKDDCIINQFSSLTQT